MSVLVDRSEARQAASARQPASALKEWAAVVKALEGGSQVLILRKGGVREDGFSSEAESFFLYPTGFHQTPEKLRPEHRHFLAAALAEKPPEGRVRIASFARVAGTFAVSSAEKLAGLAEEYVYTADEMKKRYEFRPGEALTALVVRVFRLPRPVEIPVRTKYGGCVSWINLEAGISTENAEPALTDSQFDQRLARIHSLLR